MPTEVKRGRGRPRTRPVNPIACTVYLSADQLEVIDRQAADAKVSRSAWLAVVCGKAAKKRPRKEIDYPSMLRYCGKCGREFYERVAGFGSKECPECRK